MSCQVWLNRSAHRGKRKKNKINSICHNIFPLPLLIYAKSPAKLFNAKGVKIALLGMKLYQHEKLNLTVKVARLTFNSAMLSNFLLFLVGRGNVVNFSTAICPSFVDA
jgi:hypothetical protein